MRKLIRGIAEFRRHRLAMYREKFSRLALGQSPDTLFIACSDSRVVPNLFASTDPGDLFVIRNVGNLVAPCHSAGMAANTSEWAAIEFSILQLRITDIIVCGHSECGAIHAMLSGRSHVPGDHLQSWLQYANDAATMLPQIIFDPVLKHHNQISQANVLLQLEHLRTSPLIQQHVAQGTLHLHAWWFDIALGNVYAYTPETQRFSLVGA